jgi:hypothetical protein
LAWDDVTTRLVCLCTQTKPREVPREVTEFAGDQVEKTRDLVRRRLPDDLHEVLVWADAAVEPDFPGDVQPQPLDGLK